MKFTPTSLKGAYLVDIEKLNDERGFFARVFCQNDFAERGLSTNFIQVNNSLSLKKSTLRGLHYQLAPMQEEKLVRCIRGTCYDLILDLRPDSETFGQSFGAHLSEDNRTMMYVPKGFAHGFLTLADDTELLYMVTQHYSPKLERGIRWDDPTFAIKWPSTPLIISERDQRHPNYQAE